MKKRKDVEITPSHKITSQGLEKLKNELSRRENVYKKSLQSELIQATGHGDERENDGFSLAFEAFKENQNEITKLKNKIKSAKVVESEENSGVQIGSKVVLEFNGEKKDYILVGEHEGDSAKNLVSINSPIGKELLNKIVGSVFEIETPKGKSEYKIIEIK